MRQFVVIWPTVDCSLLHYFALTPIFIFPQRKMFRLYVQESQIICYESEG